MKRETIWKSVPCRKGRTVFSALLAAVLLLWAALPAAAAAAEQEPEPVDLSRPVSMTITPGPSNMLDDLADADLVLDVYRVAAAVAVEGADTYTFQPEGAFAGMTIDPAASTDGWRGLAQQAAAIVRATPTLASVSVEVDGSSGTAADTTPLVGTAGLYLVIAHGSDIDDYWTDLENGTIATLADTAVYQYHFGPELVALPGRYSEVLDNGTPNLNMSGNDMANVIPWVYDVKASLKPDREERTGSLRIVKTLESYENSQPATFVFDVTAVLDGEVVYSNVHAMIFNAAGDQTLTIDDLPAGAVVTVTEVNSGTNYELVTDETVTATVSLEEVAEVRFTNRYNEKHYGGGSIINSFTYSETDEQNWTWTQIYDR